ncbi:hypothetical protein ABZV31_04710 [Streptomyces sp. NPDC005202]|uniref:hypothetical protein n=1 Tax=Streptomyces sp. NPDC005202 TaxID=3157021 RepID=UPI0033BFA69B
MPARRQLLPTAVVFAAAALLLTGCSSGGGTSAGHSPSHTPATPSATDTAPTAPHTTPGHGTPSTAGPSRSVTTPELGITTLRPGGTITLPATVGYTITGLHFTSSDGYRLHLTLGGSGSYSLDLPLDGPAGTVTIPRDKMLPGKRDLTFTVVRAADVSAWSAQHATHVADVTIYGPK